VQIPCIEYNAQAEAKATDVAQSAQSGDGECLASLGLAIRAMWETGQDMKPAYTMAVRIPVSAVE